MSSYDECTTNTLAFLFAPLSGFYQRPSHNGPSDITSILYDDKPQLGFNNLCTESEFRFRSRGARLEEGGPSCFGKPTMTGNVR